MAGIEPIELDVRRLLCPLPVVRMQSCVEEQQPGQQIRVRCDAKSAVRDLKTWCRLQGHHLISQTDQQDETELLIEVGV